MTDINTPPPAAPAGAAPPAAPPAGVVPGSPIVGGGTPPATERVNPLDGLTPDQVDALAARIEEARKNRPPSLAQQLAALEQSMSSTSHELGQKAAEKRAARDDADALGRQLRDIRQTFRRTELMEAAKAAGFKSPDVVAEMLVRAHPPVADSDGVVQDINVSEIVAKAAASGAFAMSTPAASAEVGGQGSKVPPGMDPGRAKLIEEIKAARGI